MRYIKFKNLQIDWDSMGISEEEFNSDGSDDGVIFQNGKLFGFNRNENGFKIYSEYCVENELNYTKEKVVIDFFDGFCYESSPLNRDFGLCVSYGEVELFDDLSEDLRELDTIRVESIESGVDNKK